MRDFDDNEFPLAYFISFRTYGTWLHGDARGSMDLKHNVYGAPKILHNPSLERSDAKQLKNPTKPEPVRDSFKAYATRKLRTEGLLSASVKPWARHGSTAYLWKERDVAKALEYVMLSQGDELFRPDDD